MREALAARPDDDFVISAPVRRKSAVKPKQTRKPHAGERLLSLALGHPTQTLAAIFLAGCGGVIAWNALVHQSARHPAPLFSQRAPMPEQAASAPAAPAPARLLPPARPAAEQPDTQAFVPVQEPAPHPAPAAPAPAGAPAITPPKPVARGGIADMIRNGGEPAKPKPQQAAAAPVPTAAPAARDPIAEMIRMGGPVPTPPANVGPSSGSDLVLSGQRALAKMGYGIKVDGIMGAGTRQAIEAFEQSRHLPVTGEFSPRTVRELQALSGIPVQ